ncbi:hypothetical protein NEOLEDRAFT_1076573 [Neolentinus lepideus HHB14362 ss-1]|uniref:Phytochrome n=1 Tax=Neolentinus lepideus HHB14362 ss-1 TaxID=1314782 RepID=A0A165NQG9_9AGAM|nr:hypothetical protein NEOLEDRAFT_1076573 [Neolentinus lepideus HHB14362 ss-1]
MLAGDLIHNASSTQGNYSDSGIVHLGPAPSTKTDSSSNIDCSRAQSLQAGTPSGSSSGGYNGSRTSTSPLTSNSSARPDGEVNPGDAFCLPPRSAKSESRSGMNGSSNQQEPLVTFRFEHRQDDDGYHVVVGREGQLIKCEDEPIRTPGAVQGFGVLMVVQEDEESGVLSVRQVSENAPEILGLSPKYLFSLTCFTETLTDTQADLLWDNIQYLNDPDSECEGHEDSPHVFLVTGYGEPGSALPEEESTDPQNRRSWTCWCAAHRPGASSTLAGSAKTAPAKPRLIILEFELEKDSLNPLYPPNESNGLNFSSPSDVDTTDSPSSSSSTESSGRTLVSAGQGLETASRSGSGSPEIDMASSETLHEESPPAPVVPLITTGLEGLEGEEDWLPTPEQIFESTTNHAKPLLALERIRRMSQASCASISTAAPRGLARGSRGRRRGGGSGAVGMMDVFSVMAQINEQLGAAPDLEYFLKVVVGVIKDLTQFHRVLVYQFDEMWNGQTVAELVDWSKTHDLYKGLHFPASDIPAQARQLYAINKVRLLYDRSQTTARIVAKSKEDLDPPLNMTHCYLRAMSPIHLKYLRNMGVRASMSISIMAFDQLWGLVACHSYGQKGMRVSFPVRQMLRLLSQSISRNIERLSYAQRLHTRKLINTMTSEQHPGGYIVSNADDLLSLFDADFGMLVIGEGAKILGANQNSQEILIMAEYLRLKQFTTMQVSHIVTKDYPDLQLTMGLEVIAGLLYVPLSSGGKDFIAFLRKGQPRKIHWAGKPYKDDSEGKASLEPRRSFKVWSETVAGRCRAWTEEQLETAGVLALVYGKFIEVWRQKENALQTTKLTELLLSNASHEVRTPLNHIINYLEMALNGPLDMETRDNLSRSHAASKSLLFTINDLLDLTRLESGNETSFSEPFNIRAAIEEAIGLYRNEASRRGIAFNLDVDLSDHQTMVVGDAKKIRSAVANLTANALKFTTSGAVNVTCRAFKEPEGLRDPTQVAIEIIVADTGCGISSDKLDSLFREFEQVEVSTNKASPQGLGLGLAVVARIVEQLGGQLRVDSKIGEGSRFSFLIPFELYPDGHSNASGSVGSSLRSLRSRTASTPEIEGIVDAIASHHVIGSPPFSRAGSTPPVLPPLKEDELVKRKKATPYVTTPAGSVPPVKIDADALDREATAKAQAPNHSRKPTSSGGDGRGSFLPLRVLIVEDDEINRAILAKRLTLDGHTVVNTTNGQECVDMIENDIDFDCVLMDVQMPILNGFEATERIREFERGLSPLALPSLSRRKSHQLNGRIPIFAVSASLLESQQPTMLKLGIDGWILKPIDFKRLRTILYGVTDLNQRAADLYQPGSNWETGGWLCEPSKTDLTDRQ